METLFTSFIHHLSSIGFLNNETTRDFIEISKNIKQTNSTLKFKEAATATLLYFITSLTDEKKKILTLDLINAYRFQRIEKATNILERIFKIKRIIRASSVFDSLKKRNEELKPILKKKKSSKAASQANNDYNKFHLETSWEEKERKEFEQCTFKPNTNYSISYTNPNSNRVNTSIFDKLYQDSEIYEAKRQIKAQERDHYLSKQNTFKPILYTSSYSSSSPSKNLSTSFKERQQTYFDNKQKRQEKIINSIDNDYNSKCSFSPRVNHNKIYMTKLRYQSPAHIRLYNDNKIRRNRERAKSPQQTQNSNSIRTFDSNKIAELYNSYKNKKNKIQQIRQEMEIEQGITFEPHLNRDNKYYQKINTNIIDRTNKMLEDKKRFIDRFVEERDADWKKKQYGNREYSNDEKNQITQRIIERLYGKEVEKIRSRVCEGEDEDEEGEETKERNISEYQQDEREEEGNSDTYHNEANEPKTSDEKYNDKIISIDDYTFGKKKKKNEESERNYNNYARDKENNDSLNPSNPSHGSFDEAFNKVRP